MAIIRKSGRRKKLNLLGFIFLVFVLLLGILRLLSGEDNWICQNGEWVEHGHPIAPKPTTPCPGAKPTSSQQLFKVIHVLDGDTIELKGGQKVRYIGIDTAEIDDKDPVKLCYAKKAFEKNKELVEGKEVRLEKDISETDKYGRFLRYVYVDDIFVNDYLVRNGFANVATYPPDVKFKNQFLEAEKEARENKRGLWNSSACLN